jgi:hypothetical protein
LGEFLSVIREILAKHSFARECHQEDFVVFLRSSYKPINGVDGRPDFSFHAATCVQDDSNADGDIVVSAKMGNVLGLTIFVDDEIVSGEVADVPAGVVGYSCDDVHETHVHANLRGYDGADRQQRSKNRKRL